MRQIFVLNFQRTNHRNKKTSTRMKHHKPIFSTTQADINFLDSCWSIKDINGRTRTATRTLSAILVATCDNCFLGYSSSARRFSLPVKFSSISRRTHWFFSLKAEINAPKHLISPLSASNMLYFIMSSSRSLARSRGLSFARHNVYLRYQNTTFSQFLVFHTTIS